MFNAETTSFAINGNLYSVSNEDSCMLLSKFIRERAYLKGTKVMCESGVCGACVVTMTRPDNVTGKLRSKSVASCLVPIYYCDSASITTNEGLGNEKNGYNHIQMRLDDYKGSQCGFCSSGIVMNLHSVLAENPKADKQLLEDALDSNICRCTGYRPILDTMKSFAKGAHIKETTDIEDIHEWACISKKDLHDCQSCLHNGSAMKIYNPDNLAKLYSLLQYLNHSNYKITSGNTSTTSGSKASYDAVINLYNVAELYQYSTLTECPIELGSNITLYNVIMLFRKVAQKDIKYNYFNEAANYIESTANRHVRNVATWSGNIMMKHKNHDFQSDIYLLFEAIQATLIIKHFNGNVDEVNLKAFLNIDMHGKIIEKVKFPLLEGIMMKTFRVLPRATNAPAHVSAIFITNTDEKNNFLVKDVPTITYTGINKTFSHAKNTEHFLKGKELASEEVLKQTFRILNEELIADNSEINSFKNKLGKALFYKYLLNLMLDLIDRRNKSGGHKLFRPVSNGFRETFTNRDRWPITQPVNKIEGLKQCAGEIRYVSDLLPQPNQLYAAFVITSVGNAKIKHIDTSEAMKIFGVKQFIGAKDLPEGVVNSSTINNNPEMQEEIFCTENVYYAGQAVGLIVANTDEIAREAASLVQIEYYDRKKPKLQIDDLESIADFHNEDSFQNHTYFKDILANGVKDGYQAIRGAVEFGGQYHYFLENHFCQSIPTEDGFEIWSTTQSLANVQAIIKKVLGINYNRIVAKVKPLGGAFGGKLKSNLQIAAACTIASYMCQQPVQLNLPLDVAMKMLGKRFPYIVNYSASFNKDGKLKGVYIAYYNDCGTVVNAMSSELATKVGDNVYESPAWILLPVKVKTNLPANTYFRAPGILQALTSIEVIMDHIAHSLKKDSLDIRMKNIAGIENEPLNSYLGRIIMISKEKANYKERKEEVENFNKSNKWNKKGLNLMPIKYPVSYYSNKFHVKVNIFENDGSIVVTHGGIEMGQGINTKVAQVCAAILKAPLELIKVASSDTNQIANNMSTNASIGSDLCCYEASKCCKIIKERMNGVENLLETKDWKSIISECKKQSIDLSAQSSYSKDDAPFDYDVYAVAVTDITVDILSGDVIINRVDILYDCGQSLSPELDIGQIEGGFIQGLGLMLTEKLIYDTSTGENMTHNAWTYFPPTAKDIPVTMNVRMLENASNHFGVLSAKSTGEQSVCLSGSILLAIRNAIQAHRTEMGFDEWFMVKAPATHSEILKHCIHTIDNFKLE